VSGDFDHRALLRRVVDDVLNATRATGGGREALEAGISEAGWRDVALGAGGDEELADLAVILQGLGRHGASAPLLECHVAAWVAGRTEGGGDEVLVLPRPGSDEVVVTPAGGGARITGTVARTPWIPGARSLLVLAGALAVRVEADADGVELTPGANLAGEPRMTVRFSGAPAVAADVPGERVTALPCRAAALNCALMLGALEGVHDLTHAHVTSRVQFGRPLARFQMVSATVALIAGALTGARAAVDSAIEANRAGRDPVLETAAAKVWLARAATDTSRLAHQVTGAMGLTEEYGLGGLTRRLLAWRDEWGTKRAWAETLARKVAGARPESAWAQLTAVS
jgi:acyl-CoA dehydrogenase